MFEEGERVALVYVQRGMEHKHRARVLEGPNDFRQYRVQVETEVPGIYGSSFWVDESVIREQRVA